MNLMVKRIDAVYSEPWHDIEPELMVVYRQPLKLVVDVYHFVLGICLFFWYFALLCVGACLVPVWFFQEVARKFRKR